MSHAGVAGAPRACSGAMYAGVPPMSAGSTTRSTAPPQAAGTTRPPRAIHRAHAAATEPCEELVAPGEGSTGEVDVRHPTIVSPRELGVDRGRMANGLFDAGTIVRGPRHADGVRIAPRHPGSEGGAGAA